MAVPRSLTPGTRHGQALSTAPATKRWASAPAPLSITPTGSLAGP